MKLLFRKRKTFNRKLTRQMKNLQHCRIIPLLLPCLSLTLLIRCTWLVVIPLAKMKKFHLKFLMILTVKVNISRNSLRKRKDKCCLKIFLLLLRMRASCKQIKIYLRSTKSRQLLRVKRLQRKNPQDKRKLSLKHQWGSVKRWKGYFQRPKLKNRWTLTSTITFLNISRFIN